MRKSKGKKKKFKKSVVLTAVSSPTPLLETIFLQQLGLRLQTEEETWKCVSNDGCQPRNGMTQYLPCSPLQGNFTGILQLCLFTCFCKTPEIRQFTFMDHQKALCKYMKITVLGMITPEFKKTDRKTFFKKTKCFSICSV